MGELTVGGIAALVSATASAGTAAYELSQGKPKMPMLPPPPGASMLDPNGTQAAADLRRRQAAAGGLNSTITGAGNMPAPPSLSGPTAGAKSTLG